MTLKEAEKIYKGWQEYVEIADKMSKVFSTIPQSFLPYPPEVLEEALNLIAKKYFESGNKRMVDNIQNTMVSWLGCAKDDEEAIELMKKELELMLGHPELKKVMIENLKESQKSWLKFKD